MPSIASLWRDVVAKYDALQPRVPKGGPNGGQWARAGGAPRGRLHDPAPGGMAFAPAFATPVSLTPAARARLDQTGTRNPLPARGAVKIPGHMDAETGKRFASWFGAGAMRDADGTPLVLTHGTRNDFTTFGTSYSRFSTLLGPHFALDPRMTGAFTTGQYAQIDATSAARWQHQAAREGKPMPDFIPIDARTDRRYVGAYEYLDTEPRATADGQRPYYQDTMVRAGGRTIPVYANVKRPRIVAQREVRVRDDGTRVTIHHDDDSAVRKDAERLIFTKRPALFARAAEVSGVSREAALALHAHFHGGPKIPEAKYGDARDRIFGPYGSKNFASLVSDMSLMNTPFFSDKPASRALARAMVRAYKQDLRRMGYDSVLYVNTSSNETTQTGARNPSALIVFGPQQVKSVWARQFNRKAHQFTKSADDDDAQD